MSDTTRDAATQLAGGPDHATIKQTPATLPIIQSTTFVIDDDLNAAFARGDYRSEHLYTRHSNPTTDALQDRLATLHGAEDAVVTASGMAAISATFFGLTAPGDTVIADTLLYGAASTFLSKYLRDSGRNVVFVPFADDEQLARACDENNNVVALYGETLANPLVQALDIPRVAAHAERLGAELIVDNTFANPLVCRPLDHGASVVIESLSKSIAGHSDVHAGLVCGAADKIQPVWHAMIHLGGCLDPHAAWLVWRGSKTLAMRTDTAQSNARIVADALRAHPAVSKVYFADTAAKNAAWLAGPSHMLSFVVDGGDAAAHRLMDALQVLTPATSLGGVESLVSLPYNTSHRTVESQVAIGLLPGTVRVSIGCESARDLVADLTQALDA